MKMDTIAFERLSNELSHPNRNKIEGYLLGDHDDMETHQEISIYPHKSNPFHFNKDTCKKTKIRTERNNYYGHFHR